MKKTAVFALLIIMIIAGCSSNENSQIGTQKQTPENSSNIQVSDTKDENQSAYEAFKEKGYILYDNNKYIIFADPSRPYISFVYMDEVNKFFIDQNSTNSYAWGYDLAQNENCFYYVDRKEVAQGHCSDVDLESLNLAKESFLSELNSMSLSIEDLNNLLADISKNKENYEFDGTAELATPKENTTETTPKPTIKTSIETYDPGMYKVGVDMPAGDYMLMNLDRRAYYAICSDPNGDDIISNDNFNYNSIITVIDGDYLELSRCNAFPLDEFNSHNELNTDGEGMFLIGTHVPAGEYKIEVISEGDRGYYAILNDTREGDIKSNDIFEGSRYIEVSHGDILELSRCRLVK